MSIYTHYEVPQSPPQAWDAVLGDTYTFSPTMITFTNGDGTLTRAYGSFTQPAGILMGGFTEIERTSANGQIVYEKITGFHKPINYFVVQQNPLAGLFTDDDQFYGFSGNDTFKGGIGEDLMVAGDGDLDVMFGKDGYADRMIGGAGSDHYHVDDLDIVIERADDEGIDAIFSESENYTLPANVELLEFHGNLAHHVGTGNEIGNYLRGNLSDDTLYGLGGDDVFWGFGGMDLLVGGMGDDTYNLHPGSTVLELANEGIDTVSTGFATYVLPDNVENLQFGGAVGIGNELDNVFSLGGGGTHELYGLAGNDTFNNNFSNALMDGGEGDDTAVYNTNLAGWSIVDRGDMVFITAGTEQDRAVGIEHLKFKDGAINYADGDPLFDTIHYMTHNADVFHAGVNALEHYNANGRYEGRDPNAFFDTSAYLSTYQDAAASGMNPLAHYHQVGWQLGHDPAANFDTRLYLLRNPDVAAAGIDPLQHYLQFGMAEGRQAYAAVGESIVGGFDAEFYLRNNPDVAAAGVDPLAHFNASGWHEGRNPNAWFDTAGYLAHYADVAAAGVNPLEHYMAFGWKEGRDSSAGFDTLGYLAANPDVAAAQVNPLEHYLMYGIYEGRQMVNDGMWH